MQSPGPMPSTSSVPADPAPAVPPVAGLVLAPFRALRYDSTRVADPAAVTSPPYDVIDADGVAALEAASVHNVVRLILPREPAGGGAGGPTDRYAAARDRLATWRSEGVLRPDPQPALYVYEQHDPAAGHTQRGLVGALALTPPQDGIVLPHENTMAGPVSDRLALYTAVDADLEPIFLVYDGGGAASEAVAQVPDRPAGDGGPLVDLLLPDGLRHRIWALTDPDLLAAVAADLLPRHALIADGHHRYATYLARQQARWAAGDGPGPWDFGLTFLVDATAFGPQVHPIHRVVPGRPLAELADAAARGMQVRRLPGTDVEAGLAALAAADGAAFLLAGDGELALLSGADPQAVQDAAARAAGPGQPPPSAQWAALDVSVLHAYVVPVLWGLADSVDTVGFEHDVPAALAAAAATGGTAVLLNPTPVEAVAAVAAAGDRMPRKSTLFTPKPRSGLLLRDHRDAPPGAAR